MYKEYLKSKVVVEEMLREHPETRNSDQILHLRVFEKFGLILTPEQRSKFLKMPVNFASLGRSRRIIQNKEGRYPANVETIKARRREREAMHDEVLSKEEKMKQFSKQTL